MADEPPLSLRKVISFLIRLCTRRFYGKVTLNFQGGQITTIVQEESIKPVDLPD